VNPFAVQAIAEALDGVDIPVLVKNPVNPDLKLWLGALERVEKQVKGDVAACHRGFTYYGQQRYRNAPQWELALELRRLRPEIPLYNDPSHIAGKRQWVQEVAQHALDLAYDGLMVEVHPTPATALSDAAQQLTFQDFARLQDALVLRQPDKHDPAYVQRLQALRVQIDEVDVQLLDHLARRMKIAAEIGALKTENQVQLLQFQRWLTVYNSRTDWAKSLGLSPAFVRSIMQQLHVEALRIQGEGSLPDASAHD